MKKYFFLLCIILIASSLIFSQGRIGGTAKLGGKAAANKSSGGGGGSFPVNGVLDNFNRADEILNNATWSSRYGDGFSQITSQVVVYYTGGTSGISSGVWQASFNNNQEAYIKLNEVSSGSGTLVGVFVRTSLSGSYDGYEARARASTNDIRVFRHDSESGTILDTISQTISSGDQLGISITGSTIKVYYKVGAGAWSQIGTDYTDSTYSSGHIGFIVFPNVGPTSVDDFGGGNN